MAPPCSRGCSRRFVGRAIVIAPMVGSGNGPSPLIWLGCRGAVACRLAGPVAPPCASVARVVVPRAGVAVPPSVGVVRAPVGRLAVCMAGWSARCWGLG